MNNGCHQKKKTYSISVQARVRRIIAEMVVRKVQSVSTERPSTPDNSERRKRKLIDLEEKMSSISIVKEPRVRRKSARLSNDTHSDLHQATNRIIAGGWGPTFVNKERFVSMHIG